MTAPDQRARDRIVSDLGSTLFVSAGAGSGKTTALVDRIVALVTSGGVQLESVAAVTFTDKAAAELRDRIRRELEDAVSRGGAVASSCRAALDQLDGAAIGTLHSFAHRLLAEHPIEAGIPPRVDVLDEVSSGVEFDRRWTTFRDELLADPAQERTILLLLASGVRHEALRYLAVAFDENWDLVEERVDPDAPEPPSVHDMVGPALAAIETVCDERSACTADDDKLALRLEEIAGHVARLRSIDDEIELLDALGPDATPKLPSFKVGNYGKSASWPFDIGVLKAQVASAGDALASGRGAVSQACAKRLAGAIRRFTLDAVEQRRSAGTLEFHDLLVMARSLLRDPAHGAAVRTHLHERYARILLDEFQDTDPIQIELAVRIAAADPSAPESGTASWREVPVADGHLFVVGDPKQSIYRFRRADIRTFLAAQRRFGGDAAGAAGAVALTANFRAGRPVIEWVNHVFAELIVADADASGESQAPFVALDAVHDGASTGPPVAVLGRDEHPTKTPADVLRGSEAKDVVATIVQAVADGWTVRGREGWRPARLGDIAILVPARTSLPFLEDELERAGIAYRAESSSLVYATRAVRDLLMVLRAVDDPTDHLRIVSALRTPLFGCGDDDLFRFKIESGGHWGYLGDQPGSVPVDDPVRVGLEYLRDLHRERYWLAPSELLDRIARDRRAMELGFAEGRPRDVWRRLRFVIDQARAWSDAVGGSTREYLHWVQLQTADGARVAEAVLPETDDDAVRIMTIHAAKGLEFPIAIVSGMSTVPQTKSAPAQVVFPPAGEPGYKFGSAVETQEFTEWKPVDEQMAFEERIRLLYVACTRARDHLVVSLHRKARAGSPDGRSTLTNAELLVEGMGSLLSDLPDAFASDEIDVHVAIPRVLQATRTPSAPAPFDQWKAELDSALAAASRPTAVAATALADDGTRAAPEAPDAGLQKRQRDLDLPPWLKGRYGTAVGRAVHGVLQTIDLRDGAGIDAAVVAQCEAEAVPDRVDDVLRLVRDALGSQTVREAATLPHWREVYACTPLDGRLLEGYIDLLFRGPDGLVVVDYKTAATSDPEVLDQRVAAYRLQGASYALSVGAATGEPVVQVRFIFLTPDGAVERALPALTQAVAAVRALVLSGREVIVEGPAAG